MNLVCWGAARLFSYARGTSSSFRIVHFLRLSLSYHSRPFSLLLSKFISSLVFSCTLHDLATFIPFLYTISPAPSRGTLWYMMDDVKRSAISIIADMLILCQVVVFRIGKLKKLLYYTFSIQEILAWNHLISTNILLHALTHMFTNGYRWIKSINISLYNLPEKMSVIDTLLYDMLMKGLQYPKLPFMYLRPWKLENTDLSHTLLEYLQNIGVNSLMIQKI